MNGDGRSETWRRWGSYFHWAPRSSGASSVEVFHVEVGDRSAPALLLVHGFPTCSIDWFGVVERVRDGFRVCALDFPGYGFSDKPLGWGYSLGRDAELLRFYVRQVLGAESLVVMAHDRGSSVALNYILAQEDGVEDRSGDPRVENLVLTNANLYLPLSNLTDFQRLVLSSSAAPAVLDVLTPTLLASGMGSTTFSPPRSPDDPDVEALAATFAHADGVKVLHETIQYLVERAEHELDWLRSLSRTDISTTVIWGLEDSVSPPRVATQVWSEFLMHKPGHNRFYLLPGANHYLQVDRPDALVATLLHALSPESDVAPGPIASGLGSAVLVDSSRAEMPSASEVLAPKA